MIGNVTILPGCNLEIPFNPAVTKSNSNSFFRTRNVLVQNVLLMQSTGQIAGTFTNTNLVVSDPCIAAGVDQLNTGTSLSATITWVNNCEDQSGGLSTAAIVGIAVGCSCFVAIIVAVIIYVIVVKKRKKQIREELRANVAYQTEDND